MRHSGFIADDEKRLWKALETEVLREYAPELVNASFWKRRFLDWKIRQEVKRRMKNLSSPDSLYFAKRLSLFRRTES